MPDSLRLAVGTLTALRVPAPRTVNRVTARNAMLMAPLVGFAIGILAEVAAATTRVAIPGYSDRFLVAVVGVGTLAVLTRGMHLDGLADTADGLGSGKHGQPALDIMRRSDIGAFGVITLVLVLLLQISALTTALLVGRGTLALIGGAVVARLAITWTCRRGVPAARTDGLGWVVANNIRPIAALAVTAGVSALLVLGVWWDDDVHWRFAVNVLVAMVAALVVSQLLVQRTVKRWGGVTGDVMGATAEVAFTVFVVIVSFG
ncbi:MAG TPA: adenosylcobinamide-GDP ribazoletransferase [Actinomycetes bacterium]|nr:adenosylcobinamide-GDP ribazoletransferase [Actinomycetes bacterium]